MIRWFLNKFYEERETAKSEARAKLAELKKKRRKDMTVVCPHCKSKYQFRDLKGRGTKNEVIEPKGIFCKIAFIECPDCDELFCLVLSLNEDGTGPLVRTYTLRDEK